jgi:hypothetical protein
MSDVTILGIILLALELPCAVIYVWLVLRDLKKAEEHDERRQSPFDD